MTARVPGPAHGRDRVSSPAVSPSKEIKVASAARRSSMSSCGSGGYFSSSPTLSSSPPVPCNPKSGEWRPRPFARGCGDAGSRAGVVKRILSLSGGGGTG